MSDSPLESPSGIKITDDGTRYIGGSTRSDGSVRKTFKVRPGYTPPEDVAKYVPRARRQLDAGITPVSITPPTKPTSRLSPAMMNITKTLEQNRDKAINRGVDTKSDVTDITDALSSLSINKDKKSATLDEKNVVKPKAVTDKPESSANTDLSSSEPKTNQSSSAQPSSKAKSISPPTSEGKASDKANDEAKDEAKVDQQETKGDKSVGDSKVYIPPWKRKNVNSK